MASTAWRGALDVSGFPVNVRFYGRVKSRSGESFRQLDPKHKQPCSSVLRDVDGNDVERADVLKGVEHGKGQYVALTPDQVELIAEGERSSLIEAEQWVPLETVDLSLALSTYMVVADGDVPGSARSANLVWNGLRASGLAYVSRLTMKSGSRDAIVVIYANDDGMFAATMPFVHELNDVPESGFHVDQKQAEMFQKAVIGNVEVTDFEVEALESEYRQRRAQAIEAALKGKPLPKPVAKGPLKQADADLMALLESQIEEPKAAKPKAAKKAKARRKVAA